MRNEYADIVVACWFEERAVIWAGQSTNGQLFASLARTSRNERFEALMSQSADARSLNELRLKAEESVAHQNLPVPLPVDVEPQKLLHELTVRQIELELQNEELRRVQTELEASRILYRDLYDLAPIGYCTLDDQGIILQANVTAAKLLGVVRDSLLKQPIRRFIANEEQDTFYRYSQQLVSTEGLHSCDLRMVTKSGTPFWARLNTVREPGAGNERVYRTTFGDISESKRLEDALREQEAFFHLIAENLSDFIAVLDPEGRRLYSSPSYQQFFGSLSELQGTNSFAEVHPDDRERVKQVFMETVRSGEGRQIDYRFVLADGSIREMESRGSVIKNKEGQVIRVVVVSRDVTERKRLQEQVHQMAFHDPLTRLPNRRLFSDRLRQAMAASSRSACFGALMFLDLDSFKPLNDAYGHDVGDLLLVQVAERLKCGVREMDTVARFGGDEFVVMLGQLDVDEAESITQAEYIAEKLRAALSEPYILDIAHVGNVDMSVEYRCTASIGIALINHQEVTQGVILRRADVAMYQAKHAGGNQVRFCAKGQ
ncbi:MAG: sensor domain-containing diguanylate cyclase [Betaproteobacteria bacterium]|nr:sensor domain-containing diguanylate cyclase [Betaproteobacteria bacterium]